VTLESAQSEAGKFEICASGRTERAFARRRAGRRARVDGAREDVRNVGNLHRRLSYDFNRVDGARVVDGAEDEFAFGVSTTKRGGGGWRALDERG
jgi:hypothetical protein